MRQGLRWPCGERTVWTFSAAAAALHLLLLLLLLPLLLLLLLLLLRLDCAVSLSVPAETPLRALGS